ncbi:PREDICTED: uncharacterized protein LOC108747066 [Trachymyrmex septentrionalis]|uniref:uncharacterized protein LOC108747066 n=1 Tax=Trachymyrmex septentrionalis TaxID=34720 RepID=UPI00084ED107|nr:PREDICTED: uncharacterized protein LOC108747066 [Trachymyrmex septentrionalis]
MASKKKRVTKLPMPSLIEPVRKSVLDVIQRNLRVIDSKTYITRVIYIGKYYETHEIFRKRMENIMRDLCVDDDNSSITGLLVVYPLYYIHILEAWEDMIYKHYELINLMFVISDDVCRFGKTISLPSYHHVHQRFFSAWCHVYMIPLTLPRTIEAQTLDDILKEVLKCLIKVYTFCEYIVNMMYEQSIAIKDVLLGDLGDKAARYLPESTVLKFLLSVNLPVFKSVEEYLQMYSDASPSAFWDDNNVWPPPCDIMPRDAFDGRKISDQRNSEK